MPTQARHARRALPTQRQLARRGAAAHPATRQAQNPIVSATEMLHVEAEHPRPPSARTSPAGLGRNLRSRKPRRFNNFRDRGLRSAAAKPSNRKRSKTRRHLFAYVGGRPSKKPVSNRTSTGAHNALYGPPFSASIEAENGPSRPKSDPGRKINDGAAHSGRTSRINPTRRLPGDIRRRRFRLVAAPGSRAWRLPRLGGDGVEVAGRSPTPLPEAARRRRARTMTDRRPRPDRR